jgi:hypothetical protein
MAWPARYWSVAPAVIQERMLATPSLLGFAPV